LCSPDTFHGQHVHHQREVNGHVHAEAQPANGHTDQETGDYDGGLGERAQEYLLRNVGLGAADLIQQVVGRAV
jgi:hypothetical protein